MATKPMKDPWTTSPIKSPLRSTSIAGFINGLVMTTNSHAGSYGQDHLFFSLLMQLHHDHSMLIDNSQSCHFAGSRISLSELSRSLSLPDSML